MLSTQHQRRMIKAAGLGATEVEDIPTGRIPQFSAPGELDPALLKFIEAP